MRFFSLFALAAALAVVVAAADDDNTNLSEFFSEKDAAALEASLTAEASAKGGVFGSAEANYQGAWALTLLSSSNLSKNKAALCKAAASDLSAAVAGGASKTDLAVAADALRLHALLSCGTASNGDIDVAATAAKDGLNSANPATIFHSVAVLAAAKKSVDAGDLSAVIQSLVDLQKEDGTFGPDGDDEGTLEASGQALEAIKTVAGLTKLQDSDWDTLSQVSEKASALVDKMMESVEAEANLVAVVQIFEGLQLLANSPAGDKISIENENVAMIADILVAVKSSPLTTEAGYVIKGIQLAADNKFYVPIVVSVVTKSLSAAARGQDGFVKVRVTDVQGKSIGKAAVTVLSARLGDQVIQSNVKLNQVSGQSDLYEFDFASNKLEQGSYSLEIQVQPENKSKPYGDSHKVKRTVRATTTAAIGAFEIAVNDARSGEGQVKIVEFPKKVSGLSADYLQAIEISFTVRSLISNKIFHPHQAFVRFSSKKTNFEAIFVTRVTDRRQKLKVVIADAASELFKNVGGDYDIEVIVGDAHMDEAIRWNVGSINLVFAEDAAAAVSSGPKPELHHTHRLPEKRPLFIVSFVFTGLIFASALVLLTLLAKVNFSLTIPSGEKFLFHITLGGIMVLYVAYWMFLNMFQCLTILVPLSIVALFFGSKALA